MNDTLGRLHPKIFSPSRHSFGIKGITSQPSKLRDHKQLPEEKSMKTVKLPFLMLFYKTYTKVQGLKMKINKIAGK